MSSDTEIVKFATGTLAEMDAVRDVLEEAGIEARIVGDDLSAGLGSALTGSVEVWVKEADAKKAVAAMEVSKRLSGQ